MKRRLKYVMPRVRLCQHRPELQQREDEGREDLTEDTETKVKKVYSHGTRATLIKLSRMNTLNDIHLIYIWVKSFCLFGAFFFRIVL